MTDKDLIQKFLNDDEVKQKSYETCWIITKITIDENVRVVRIHGTKLDLEWNMDELLNDLRSGGYDETH